MRKYSKSVHLRSLVTFNASFTLFTTVAGKNMILCLGSRGMHKVFQYLDIIKVKRDCTSIVWRLSSKKFWSNIRRKVILHPNSKSLTYETAVLIMNRSYLKGL